MKFHTVLFLVVTLVVLLGAQQWTAGKRSPVVLESASEPVAPENVEDDRKFHALVIDEVRNAEPVAKQAQRQASFRGLAAVSPKREVTNGKKGGISGGSASPAQVEASVSLVAEMLKQKRLTNSKMENLPSVAGRERLEYNHAATRSVSLQEVFNKMKSNYAMWKKNPTERSLPPDAIPLLGVSCSRHDFLLMLNLIHQVDVPVFGYSITVCGRASIARIFAAAAQRLLPRFVFVTMYETDPGISRTWNLAMHRAFVASSPPRDSVFIAASDVLFPPSVIGTRIAKFHSKSSMLVTRLHDFSFFGVKREAFDLVGYADEVLFPGFNEDVEYHLRFFALGKGRNRYIGNFRTAIGGRTSGVVETNRYHNLRVMALRSGQMDYLKQKWGIDLRFKPDFWNETPYPYPFNNPSIFMNNSWIVDAEHRRCIVTTKEVACSYNFDTVEVLEGVPLKHATQFDF